MRNRRPPCRGSRADYIAADIAFGLSLFAAAAIVLAGVFFWVRELVRAIF